MEKRYVQREIRNLHDLHLEQLRVRHTYKNLESDWTKSLTSGNTIFSVLSYLFLQRKNNSLGNIFRRKRNNRLQKTSTESKAPQTTPYGKRVSTTNQETSLRKSYKKLGRTILKWEAIALLTYVGGNIALHYFRKRRHRQ